MAPMKESAPGSGYSRESVVVVLGTKRRDIRYGKDMTRDELMLVALRLMPAALLARMLTALGLRERGHGLAGIPPARVRPCMETTVPAMLTAAAVAA